MTGLEFNCFYVQMKLEREDNDFRKQNVHKIKRDLREM
jgi:hypothetical protein